MTITERKTVAVAMSGGVDSSVAAALLLEQGFNVIGITAYISVEDEPDICAEERIQKAAEAAAKLGIQHHVFDVRPTLKTLVVEPFVRQYLRGYTPNPCVACNREIKFGVLLAEALKLGAEQFATGHYARLEHGTNGRVRLLRAKDRSRDQSYFLARLTCRDLRRTVFPLGTWTKRAVKQRAADLGFLLPSRSESREICFIAQQRPGEWITRTRQPESLSGDIFDTSGRKVGEHRGLHHYTTGQRKGLRLALGYPVYVVGIDAQRNALIVGTREEATSRKMLVEDLVWVSGQLPTTPHKVLTQIRYNHEAAPSLLVLQSSGLAQVDFEAPQFAVTPGQLAVFYEEDEVLGSGWIRTTVRA